MMNLFPEAIKIKGKGTTELLWQLSVTLVLSVFVASTLYVAYCSYDSNKPILYLFLWLGWLSFQIVALIFVVIYAIDTILSATASEKDFPRVLGKVSVHVPIHCEPPELVRETLISLSKLKFPTFEVIVIDNNTSDQALWRPIEELSKKLGFRFFHLENWPGYKAGALNFATAVSSEDADFIAVVDADYVVQPDFLSKMLPYFSDPLVAFVQAPQDYRFVYGSTYELWAFFAYRHFFDITLAARERMRSVIFAGTMGIIRKSVLNECGGWDERCLTEDAEMGLRVPGGGRIGVFVNTSYGKGLMPLDYLSFRRQRYRWAFGGAQILRKYGLEVFWNLSNSNVSRFSAVQRLGFGALLLLWFATWLAIGGAFLSWLMAAIYWAAPSLPPIPQECFLLSLGLVSGQLVLFIGSSIRRSGCTFTEALGAFLVLSSVNWTVGCACMNAVLGRSAVFGRTPKDKSSDKTLFMKLQFIRAELTFTFFGLCVAFVPIFIGARGNAILYSIGSFLGSVMFGLPLLLMIADHYGWATKKTLLRAKLLSNLMVPAKAESLS
jgi:cellulose synthase/poly-beta-1,6-N-acetylglucosamine synthase-like glycosyltransferase